MTLSLKIHCFLTILALFTSCRTTKPVAENIVVYDSVYIERIDSVVTFEPDSATMSLLLECDSTGDILLRELVQERGKRLALQAQLKQTQKGTMLTIDCKQDSLQQIINGLRERLASVQNTSETKVVRERYIPTFYKVCTWVACITVAVLVIWLIVWLAVRLRRV